MIRYIRKMEHFKNYFVLVMYDKLVNYTKNKIYEYVGKTREFKKPEIPLILWFI